MLGSWDNSSYQLMIMDLYVYLRSDDKQNEEVYFDDFRVKHKLHDIVAGGDYYPFGSVMTGREVSRDDYRFGYQGQFAEKDDETGWNAFELRMFDPAIGRWLSTDPERQFASPYLGLGNNPLNLVDPDGGEMMDDYELCDDGHLELIRETADDFDRIYNSSQTASIKVEKGFISDARIGHSNTYNLDYSVFFSRDISNAKDVFFFFADNTSVEWGYNVFSKNSSIAVLSSSHQTGSEATAPKLIHRLVINGESSSIDILESIHSHPGDYIMSINWPAYPSGFKHTGDIDHKIKGDRDFRVWMEKYYKGKLPIYNQIYVPKIGKTINYNTTTYW